MRFFGELGPRDLVRELAREWKKDKASDMAAALTYYGVLAIFPLIIFMLALASLLIEPADAEALVARLSQVAPGEATAILGGRIREFGQESHGGLLTLGILGALWAASSGMGALMGALNTAYGVEETRPFWKVRGIAILTTLAASVLVVMAAAIAVALPPIAARLGGPVAEGLSWLGLPVAGLMMMFLWSLLYWRLPAVRHRFRLITPGALVGVVVWLVASWAFSLYVKNFGAYDATYGAVGGVIVLLLWMWISAQALLLGAEINAIVEHASEPRPKAPERRPVSRRPSAEERPPAP